MFDFFNLNNWQDWLIVLGIFTLFLFSIIGFLQGNSSFGIAAFSFALALFVVNFFILNKKEVKGNSNGI